MGFFKKRGKKAYRPGIPMSRIDAYYDPKKGRYVRAVYSRGQRTIYEREVTEKYLERLKRRMELSNKWYGEAESIVAEILDKDKDRFDGFKFYSIGKAYKTKNANKLRLRSDGNFDIEYTSTEYGEHWPGYKNDNNGKGYGPKAVAHEIFSSLYNEVRRVSKGSRSELIELVKKFIKIDLRKEVKERKKNGGLEDKVLQIIIFLAFLGSAFFSSPSITGNTIAELPIKTTSMIGLFMLSMCFIGILRIRKVRAN